MQKFTRNLTREIEVGGERVAVTLDADGVTLRPVGSRRPPHTVSWVGVVCAAAAKTAPGADQVAEAVKALKQGAEKAAAAPADSATAAPAEAPAHAPPAPAAAHAASGLTAVLARIDAWLAKHRADFHKGLLPGATDAECAALAAALGGSLPDELRTLMKWHNGQSADVPGAFERNFFLLGTDQIAEAKKELDAEPRNGWKPGLVPFLDDEQDDLVCLDTTHAAAPVVEVWHGKSEAAAAAPSLTAWLEDFAAALEKGAYSEDPERGSFRRKS